MGKYKKIIYIILISIIITLIFLVYSNISKSKENTLNTKILSEIKYIESKFVDLFNEINKIEFSNYSIALGQTSEQNTKGNESENSSSIGAGGSDEGTSSGGKNSSDQISEQQSNDEKKFELIVNGVLTNNEDINWDLIKSEVENLYISMATVTIDLYNLGINEQDIMEFNEGLDNLTITVKKENKEETLAKMSEVYTILSNITQQIEDNQIYKIIVLTKSDIFKAYSKVDSGDWEQISKDVDNAISNYSKLLSNENVDNEKKYNINKGYVLLKELQNSTKLQDISVFFIKYKNLLEEINSI